MVYFTDKLNSPYSISSPNSFLSDRAVQRRASQNIAITSSDIPVNMAYIDSIKSKGATVLYPLKWFNAAVIEADLAQITNILALPFVTQTDFVARKKAGGIQGLQHANQLTTNDTTFYGNAFTQINMMGIQHMHADQYKGEGMLIALFDAGFLNAGSVFCLNHLFTENRIFSTYDFVDQEADVFDDHDHGLKVLTAIAANSPDTLIGAAHQASYVLLRTEDVFSETEIEEANWARAAEYADSIGVDIISSSLGYYYFDSTAFSHTYADMDGQSTLAAKAANAAASKGILVVNSAGNEGAAAWRYIITPADADSVLAVGAVTNVKTLAYFSSVGPSADGQIKPDVVAMGEGVALADQVGNYIFANGTSFSCPQVAGLAAGLWQKFPQLSNMQLANAIKQSASLYLTPDNFMGYGIPHYGRAIQYIEDSIQFHRAPITLFPNPIEGGSYSFSVASTYLNTTVTAELFDPAGKLITTETFKNISFRNTSSIDLSMLPAGIYHLRLVFWDRMVVKKLIKV